MSARLSSRTDSTGLQNVLQSHALDEANWTQLARHTRLIESQVRSHPAASDDDKTFAKEQRKFAEYQLIGIAPGG